MKLTVLAWLAGLLGFGLLVAGVAMINLAAACIVAGVLLILWSWLVDRAAAAQARAKLKGG